jgi:hypothetical protein
MSLAAILVDTDRDCNPSFESPGTHLHQIPGSPDRPPTLSSHRGFQAKDLTYRKVNTVEERDVPRQTTGLL